MSVRAELAARRAAVVKRRRSARCRIVIVGLAVIAPALLAFAVYGVFLAERYLLAMILLASL